MEEFSGKEKEMEMETLLTHLAVFMTPLRAYGKCASDGMTPLRAYGECASDGSCRLSNSIRIGSSKHRARSRNTHQPVFSLLLVSARGGSRADAWRGGRRKKTGSGELEGADEEELSGAAAAEGWPVRRHRDSYGR
jgi:hypothetical protein